MKRRTLRHLGLGLGALALSVGLQAHADGWSSAVNLTGVSPQDDGGTLLLYLTTSQTVYDPAECTQSPSGYVVVDTVDADQILATALSAITSGAQIELYVTTTSQQNCIGGRPVVTAIEIL